MFDLLFIQHEDDVPPGTALLWAEQRGLTTKIWQIAKGAPSYALSDFKALIICGGSMDTFEEEKHPWLRDEKSFIKDCIEQGKPVFGLCLGSQLIADVMGGKVYPLNTWEIGFVPIQMKDEPTPYTLQVFHWHQCGFDLPPQAESFAEGEFWKNQAFKIGNKVMATQFHPESTVAWVHECADEVTTEYTGLVQTKQEMLDSLHLQKIQQDWFFKALDRWFETRSVGSQTT